MLLSADLPIVPVEVALPTAEPVAATHADLGDRPGDTGVAAETSRRELVVLDGRLENIDALIADLGAKRGGDVQFEYVVLNEQEPGAAQISRALATYNGDLDALHIFSHGGEQGLLLGGDWFTQQDLSDPSGGVGGWQRALSGDADLLIYGCDLASSAEGRAFITGLADVTGADVAASDDLTGNASAGGDWQLEFHRGEIESGNAFGARALASFSGTLDGTAIWSQASTPTPQTAEFNGAGFDPESNTANVGGPWLIMDGAEAPTRDEKIVVGVDAGRNLSGQIWNGSSWTAFAFNDFAADTENNRWTFAVSYESQSGDAMLVYNNGTNGLSYRTWDGAGWSGPTTIATPYPGEPSQMKLASSAASDDMTLIVSNSSNQDYALVWDGDNWGNGIALHDGTGAGSNTDVSVVYEQQSGDAMVIFGKADANAYYRTWNGATWSGEGTIPPHASATGQTRWTAAASDPNSDRIVLGALTSDRDVWLSVWDGSSWAPASIATTESAGTGTYTFAVAFESQSGDAIATYSKFDANVYYRTWSGGAWSGESIAANLGGLTVTSTMTLSADPDSNRVMLSTLDSLFDVNFTLWNGSSWEPTTQLEGSAGTLSGQPFLYLWDQNAAPAASGGEFWASTKGDGVGQTTTGITNWGHEDVLQISGVQIEPGVSGGTFSVAVELSSSNDTNAAHYVSRDMVIGASNFQLKAGDLLMSFNSNGTLTSGLAPVDAGFTNSLTYTDGDVIVFRPGTPGDYSSGTFAMLLEDPSGSGADIRGISLIESNVTIGDYSVSAGDFLFTRSGGGQDEDIWLFETTDVGSGNTSGTARMLIEGNAAGVGITDHLYSIEVLEKATTIGGRTFAAGTLLTTVHQSGTVGSNNLAVQNLDIFALHVTRTELGAGAGASAATAELVWEGADAGLSGNPDRMDALTLVTASANTAPTLSGAVTGQIVDDNATVTPFSVVTLGDADGDALTVRVQLDDAAKGVLSGGGFSDLGGGVYEYNGSIAAAQAALRALVFDPTDNRVAPTLTETTTFSITVSDGAELASNNLTTVIATSVNDAAAIGGTATGTPVNDNATVAPFSAVTITDPDVENVTVDVQLDLPAQGTLAGGGFTDLGGGHYQFTGTGAAAQAAIRALVFDPTENAVAPGMTQTTTFSITVTDSGGPLVNNATTVIATSVNDAASIGGTATGTLVNDNATVAPFSAVTIADPDAENVTVDVQLDLPAQGTLAGGGFTDLGGGHYQFSGTAAAAQAAIRALIFDPTENATAPGMTQTTTFAITVTDAGGPLVNNATTVIATSVGDPVVVGGTAALQAVNDNATIAPFSSVTISDPDVENVTVDVQLDDGAKGTLSGGGFTDLGGGRYQFTGSAAAAQAAIRALVFDPTENRVAPWLSETTTFTITATDSSGPVMNGGTSVVSTSVNDAAALGGTATGTPVNDNATVAPFSAVTITDPDAENVTVDIQLDLPAQGTLAGGGFSDLGGGHYQFSGTAAAAQAAIRALVFDPTENAVAPGMTQTTTFSIILIDAGGPLANNATTVIATSVGDPVVVGGTAALQAVNDNATIAPFSSVTITEPDGENVTVDVQLDLPAQGTLAGGGFADLGGGHYQFTGSAAAAQAAIRALVFDPTENRVAPGLSETTTFTITATDSSGPVMNGGTSVVSTSVNDAASIGGTATGTLVNDNATVAPFSAVTITDPDAENVMVDVQLDLPAQGTLAGGGFSDLGGGHYQFTGTAAAAQAAIRALVFDPTENAVAPGMTQTTTFAITVTDAGGPLVNNATTVIATSVGDPVVVGGTAALQAVNDNATIAPFSSVTITEPDGENVTVDVQLDLPAQGTLAGGGFADLGGGHYQFTGTAAAAQAAIRALVFDPTENATAPGTTQTTTFTITATDSSGPVMNGGTSVVSTSINDAAALGGTATGTPVNDNATVAPFSAVTITDPDAENVTVDIQLDLPAQGTLAGGGFTDLGGGHYQFTGSAAAAQAAIRALVFDPTENAVAPGMTQTTTFAITVTDAGGPLVNNATTVIATSVGDPVVVGGTAALQPVNDNATIAPFSSVTITEPDGENVTVDVQLDDGAKGALSGGGFADLGGGRYQFTGSAAAAQAAIRALVFDPTENRVAPGLSETTTFTITATDSSGPVMNGGTSVVSTSINDAASIGGTLAGQPGKDSATLNPFSTVTIADLDTSEILVVDVQLDDPAKGALAGGGFVNLGGGRYQFTGTAASAEAALRALTFDPADNRVVPGATETTQFTITVTESQGGSTSDPLTSVITVSVNDAPTLAAASPNLPSITEDAVANGGVTVGSILGGTINDVDVFATQGIAVTSVGGAQGVWQFSTNGGATWSNLSGASDSASRLLRANDSVRFLPNGLNAGGGGMFFRAWDQTAGAAGGVADTTTTGGETAFSTNSNFATISTTAVNDAPGAANALLMPLSDGSANPNGQTVSSLLGASIADSDIGSSLAGVAVIGNPSAGFPGGSWQYSTDGGVNWADIGTVGDDTSALVLHAASRVRFVPQPGFLGVPPPLAMRAIDNSYAGGFSTTNGGVENRTNVDASIHGGTTALSGNASFVGTRVSNNVIPPPPPPPEPDIGGDKPSSGDDSDPGLETKPGPVVAPSLTESGDERRAGRGVLEEARDAEEEGASSHTRSGGWRVGEAQTAGLDGNSAEVRDLVMRLIAKAMPELPLAELDFSVTQETLIKELDALRDQFSESLVIEQTVVGSAFAVTTGLSVGYVVWLTRGGLLLASLVSSMPAWQLMDPTPILASLAGGAQEDGESLEELIENEREDGDEDGDEKTREGDRP